MWPFVDVEFSLCFYFIPSRVPSSPPPLFILVLLSSLVSVLTAFRHLGGGSGGRRLNYGIWIYACLESNVDDQKICF